MYIYLYSFSFILTIRNITYWVVFWSAVTATWRKQEKDITNYIKQDGLPELSELTLCFRFKPLVIGNTDAQGNKYIMSISDPGESCKAGLWLSARAVAHKLPALFFHYRHVDNIPRMQSWIWFPAHTQSKSYKILLSLSHCLSVSELWNGVFWGTLMLNCGILVFCGP